MEKFDSTRFALTCKGIGALIQLPSVCMVELWWKLIMWPIMALLTCLNSLENILPGQQLAIFMKAALFEVV